VVKIEDLSGYPEAVAAVVDVAVLLSDAAASYKYQSEKS